MNYRNVEDKTQNNPAAERFLALDEEHRVYADRLDKALAHREAFSEKVLVKVTGEYRSRLEQLARERSVLEAQLRSELAAFEKQLQAVVPARDRFREELEELELRHVTGELGTADYTRRKAAIEAQMPAGASSLDVLHRNVGYYRDLLGGAVTASAATAVEPSQQLDEPLEYAAEAEEDYPEYGEPAQPGHVVEEFAADGEWTEAEAQHAVYAEEPDAEVWTEGAEEHDAAPAYAPDPAEQPVHDEDEAYFDPRGAVEELQDDEAADDYFGSDAPAGAQQASAPGYADPYADPYGVDESAHDQEEDLFQSEFEEAHAADPYAEDPYAEDPYGEPAAQAEGEEWYPAQGGFEASPDGALLDEAVEDLDQFAGEPLAEDEEVEIPEELLLDEDEDFLEVDASDDDSAALMHSTERLLDEEEFGGDLGDLDTGQRTLEPAVVIHEGQPDEKVYYMTSNVLSIGRGPDNDIQLSTDTSVSRHHSRITYEDDEYWITDLGSSNGTIVNGARVSKTVLTGDDEVSIGQTVLKFRFL